MRYRSLSAAVLVAILGAAPGSFAADLKPDTLEGFQRYVQATEALRAEEFSHPNTSLYIEALPGLQREAALETLLRGQIFIGHLRTRGTSGHVLRTPGGMIHHWVGDILIPGATLHQVLTVVRDYSHYQDFYRPEVVRSRLLSHEDDSYEVYLRLNKESIVTVTYNIISEVHYTIRSETEASSRGTYARIAEVDDAGTPNEHEEPFGHDSGYLWGVDSYWRYEQRKEGVIAEWEFISLSRGIPPLLSWFVRPLVSEIARDTLRDTLIQTRAAVLKTVLTGRAPESRR